MSEIWKEVKEFKGYMASSYGRIKSTKRGKETISALLFLL